MMRNQGLQSNIFVMYLVFNSTYAEQHLPEYVSLQIHFEKNGSTVHFTLNCSSMYPPFGLAAEILINNITTANMRSSNGVCYISRRICMEEECSCTSHNFIYSFLSTADTELMSFTCQLRFEQENQKSQLLVYETKIYNGSAIFKEKTNLQRIAISRSDSTNVNNNTIPAMGFSDFSVVHISILICIPVTLTIIALSIICLKCFSKRKMGAKNGGKQLSYEETSLLQTDIQARQPELYTKLDETGNDEINVICHRTPEEQKLDGTNDGRPITPEGKCATIKCGTYRIVGGKTGTWPTTDANDDGKQLSPEETSLLEGNMQARVKEMHTKLDETVTDEKTIMCHIISEERKMDGIDDSKPITHREKAILAGPNQTRQTDILNTQWKKTRPDEKVMQCHKISEESSVRLLQMKQTHPQTGLNELENHTKSVINQNNTGKLANSLNLKESSAIEDKLPKRYTCSDPGLNYIWIMPDETADPNREKGVNKTRKKPGYVKIHIEENPEFKRETEPTGEKR